MKPVLSTIVAILILASCGAASTPLSNTPSANSFQAGYLAVVSTCQFDSSVTDTSEDEAFCLESTIARINTGPVATISAGGEDGFASHMFVARTTDIVVEGDGITEVMIDGNVILLVLPFPEVISGIPVDFILDGVTFRCDITNQFRVQMGAICTEV